MVGLSGGISLPLWKNWGFFPQWVGGSRLVFPLRPFRFWLMVYLGINLLLLEELDKEILSPRVSLFYVLSFLLDSSHQPLMALLNQLGFQLVKLVFEFLS